MFPGTPGTETKGALGFTGGGWCPAPFGLGGTRAATFIVPVSVACFATLVLLLLLLVAPPAPGAWFPVRAPDGDKAPFLVIQKRFCLPPNQAWRRRHVLVPLSVQQGEPLSLPSTVCSRGLSSFLPAPWFVVCPLPLAQSSSAISHKGTLRTCLPSLSLREEPGSVQRVPSLPPLSLRDKLR